MIRPFLSCVGHLKRFSPLTNFLLQTLVDWINHYAFFGDVKIEGSLIILKCHSNLHAFFYIEIVNVTPLTSTIV
jgi:hypothetical protein